MTKQRRDWSQAEDNKLRSLMAGYSWPAIARIMGRTIDACKSEANRLKLKHTVIPEGKAAGSR